MWEARAHQATYSQGCRKWFFVIQYFFNAPVEWLHLFNLSHFILNLIVILFYFLLISSYFKVPSSRHESMRKK